MANASMPVDPATQAAQLAQYFYDLATSTRDFRARNHANLSADQLKQLCDQANALEDRGLSFTADAFAAIAQQLQPYLNGITGAMKQARDVLNRLNNVAKVMAIVDSTVALVRSVADGDVGSVASDIEALVKQTDTGES